MSTFLSAQYKGIYAVCTPCASAATQLRWRMTAPQHCSTSLGLAYPSGGGWQGRGHGRGRAHRHAQRKDEGNLGGLVMEWQTHEPAGKPSVYGFASAGRGRKRHCRTLVQSIACRAAVRQHMAMMLQRQTKIGLQPQQPDTADGAGWAVRCCLHDSIFAP